MRTRVHCIQCPECKEIIYSRARHDCKTCSCGCIFIDGGLDYTRISFHPDIKSPRTFIRVVNASKQELYDDWNKGIDKFGKI